MLAADRHTRRSNWRRSWVEHRGHGTARPRVPAQRTSPIAQHVQVATAKAGARRRPRWYPAWAGLVWAVIIVAAALATWALVGALLS